MGFFHVFMEDGISSGFCWDEHGQTLVALESLEFGVCVGWVFLWSF